jgi:hypothetical protein
MHGRVATPSSNIQNRSVVARSASATGASHLPVRTMNAATLRPGQFTRPAATNNIRGISEPSLNRSGSFGGNTSTPNRNRQDYSNRPPRPAARWIPQAVDNSPSFSGNAARPNSTPSRTWNAQGNATDSGQAPRGFGGNRPTAPVRTHANESGQSSAKCAGNVSGGYNGNVRMGTEQQRNSRGLVNRPPATHNDNRSYKPPTTNRDKQFVTAAVLQSTAESQLFTGAAKQRKPRINGTAHV